MSRFTSSTLLLFALITQRTYGLDLESLLAEQIKCTAIPVDVQILPQNGIIDVSVNDALITELQWNKIWKPIQAVLPIQEKHLCSLGIKFIRISGGDISPEILNTEKKFRIVFENHLSEETKTALVKVLHIEEAYFQKPEFIPAQYDTIQFTLSNRVNSEIMTNGKLDLVKVESAIETLIQSVDGPLASYKASIPASGVLRKSDCLKIATNWTMHKTDRDQERGFHYFFKINVVISQDARDHGEIVYNDAYRDEVWRLSCYLSLGQLYGGSSGPPKFIGHTEIPKEASVPISEGTHTMSKKLSIPKTNYVEGVVLSPVWTDITSQYFREIKKLILLGDKK